MKSIVNDLDTGLAKEIGDTVDTSKTCSNRGCEENKCSCGKPSVTAMGRVCAKI